MNQSAKSHPQSNGSGLLRAWRATQCSIKGLAAAFTFESAFRQELALAVFFVPLAFYLGESISQQLLLLTLIALVLITEILNSAIEAVVDRVSMEQHPLSGRAKDLGSAAVFIALLLAGFGFGYSAWAKFF